MIQVFSESRYDLPRLSVVDPYSSILFLLCPEFNSGQKKRRCAVPPIVEAIADVHCSDTSMTQLSRPFETCRAGAIKVEWSLGGLRVHIRSSAAGEIRKRKVYAGGRRAGILK